ncbi:MAG: TrmB family transcriptional regulator [Candidatus Cloacimonetes bacterium]|nr:TrmB family transcriptional regulator [Candidatus Cloacimonadota bacterium]
MNIDDYINDLINIGLTESEAKVYFYLLKKKNFTATEISKLSNVSRRKVYEVLARLVQKGLCTETLGRVRKYSAVNPKHAIGNLFKEFEKKRKIFSNLSESLLPLYLSEKENTDPLDYIQVLRERSRIIEKVESLERSAKEEVLSFDKGPYVMNLNKTSILNREEFKMLKSGIKYKTIYEFDDARKWDFLELIEMFESAGEEVKIAYSLPLKLSIFDEKTVMIALRDRITSKPSLTSMIIEHPDIAKAFKITFYSIWREAMTLEEFKTKEKIL